MHSILWASILASAVVAVITTLLIEYLAKPSLEARKERILETYRDQRQGQKDIHRCMALMMKLRRYVYKNLADLVSDEYIHRITAELSERITNAAQLLKVPPSLSEEWVLLAIRLQDYEHFLKIELPKELSEEEVHKDLAAHYKKLQLFRSYFNLGKWDLERKRVLRRKIKSLQVEHRKVRSRATRKQ